MNNHVEPIGDKKNNMQMRPPLSKMGTVSRSDSTPLSTIPAPVYRSDLDTSTLPNDSRLRAIKTRDAPAQAILHPNLPYLRLLPLAPSDDIFSRISHYQPHLTLALSDLSAGTIISNSRPSTHCPLPCSFAFLASYAAGSPDPHIQNFFQPATTSHYSANDIASAAAATLRHLVTLTETGHRAWLQLGTWVSERWRGVRGGGGVWYAGYLCGRRGGGWKVVVYGGETGYPRKDRGTEGWWAWA